MIKKYKERRLYFYTCSKCGKENRCSFKRSKAKHAICRKCKKVELNKDQMPLFVQPVDGVGQL